MLRQFLFGAMLITSFTGASVANDSYVAQGVSVRLNGQQEATEELHRTFPLAANGVVSLENYAGIIRIKTWERNAIKIDAVKRSSRRERLAEVDIIIDASQNHISIKTKYAKENLSWNDDEAGLLNNPASVSYSLTIPTNARLDKIDLLNGTAEIEGVKGGIKATSVNAGFTLRSIAGNVDISTVNGQLEAIYEKQNEASTVSLSAVNGQLILTAAADASVQFNAYTMNGVFKNEFNADVNHTASDSPTGKIGRGDARIKLNSMNGNVNVRRAGL